MTTKSDPKQVQGNTPRFLFVLKRRRDRTMEEPLAKESQQIEWMVMTLCGLVLMAIVLLILRVVHQHWP
jgi:hypothetical protein